MANWNSWRTGGYEWLMWQKRPAGRTAETSEMRKISVWLKCVCVCFCHVDVVYVSVFMLETNTSTCCECFFHTVIVFWGTMLLFLAVLNCVETLPQDPYSAKVAACHIPLQIPTNYALGRSFETVLKLNQICSNTVVIIKDTKGSPFILNSPRSSFLSVRQQLRINAGGMPRMNRTKFILLLPLQNQSMR